MPSGGGVAMAYRIRSARKEDEPIIWTATTETFWRTVPDDERAHVDQKVFEDRFREEVEPYVRGVRGERFVAEDDAGRFLGYIIVGEVGLVYSPRPVGFVLDLWVKPEHRGRGVASFLLNRAFAWCRLRGYSKLKLEVATDNAEARALYERAGFTAERFAMGATVPPG